MTHENWTPEYQRWRHGGWYVYNTHYGSGGCGCVSNNYPDRKWRIVCDFRPNAHELYTYKTRDEAARAEHELAPNWYRCGNCREMIERDDTFCANCGHRVNSHGDRQ